MAIYYPLKPIGAARKTDDARCPEGTWKGLSRRQKGMLSQLAAEAYAHQRVQGLSVSEWRHEVAIRACGVRIREATQAHWADLHSAFLDLAGKPEAALRTQMRAGDNKRRIAMHKLTGVLEANRLHPSYAESICQAQFKVPLSEASAKQLWCLFFTITKRGDTK